MLQEEVDETCSFALCAYADVAVVSHRLDAHVQRCLCAWGRLLVVAKRVEIDAERAQHGLVAEGVEVERMGNAQALAKFGERQGDKSFKALAVDVSRVSLLGMTSWNSLAQAVRSIAELSIGHRSQRECQNCLDAKRLDVHHGDRAVCEQVGGMGRWWRKRASE